MNELWAPSKSNNNLNPRGGINADSYFFISPTRGIGGMKSHHMPGQLTGNRQLPLVMGTKWDSGSWCCQVQQEESVCFMWKNYASSPPRCVLVSQLLDLMTLEYKGTLTRNDLSSQPATTLTLHVSVIVHSCETLSVSVSSKAPHRTEHVKHLIMNVWSH